MIHGDATTAAQFALWCLVLASLVFWCSVPAGRVEVVRVVPGRRQQTFEGWGTSLCWWANAVGGWEDEAARAEIMDLVFGPRAGLGLNVVRYNIGGGENPAHNFMWDWRAMEGFRPDPDAPYRWEADAAQRWVLLEGLRRGVTITEAFSNSPPWWMTISGSATGNGKERPAENNLRPDMYTAFAGYLADVVAYYRDHLGVCFNTLAPLNEPCAGWWTLGNNQEGCRFTADRQDPILAETARCLAAKGLETKLAAPEEYSIEETIQSWQAYGQAARDLVYQINTHSYAGESRATLLELATSAGKRLYVSEYGNGINGEFGSALELARVIALDLNELRCQGWVYWQAVDNSDEPTDWHAIHVSYSQRDRVVLKKQYYALLQFTRHIRPGSVILEVGTGDVVAALAPGRDLVLVVSNREAAERPITFDLSAFRHLPAQAAYRITTEHASYAEQAPASVRGAKLTVKIPPRSINTLVLAGVDFHPR